MSQYQPPEYRWEDMSGSFQSDLCDPNEQLDFGSFYRECGKSERNSIFNSLSNEMDARKLAEQMNTFDARLIGIVNEWSSSSDKAYARDSIILDGKTATSYMHKNGYSFTDVVCEVQNAFDEPNRSKFDDIKLSIGGPAFMTSENVMESVKQRGQIRRDNLSASQRKEHHELPNRLKAKDWNRDFLEKEKEEVQLDRKQEVRADELEDIIERENQALEYAGITGKEQISFQALNMQGKIDNQITSHDILTAHRKELEALKQPKEMKQPTKSAADTKKQSDKKPEREKISFKDLEDKPAIGKPVRSKEVSKENTIEKQRGKEK